MGNWEEKTAQDSRHSYGACLRAALPRGERAAPGGNEHFLLVSVENGFRFTGTFGATEARKIF